MKTHYRNIHRARLGALMLGLSALGVSGAAEANCTDPDSSYTGSICLTAASYCPTGMAEANGAHMLISEYTQLYALLGTTYGGDRRTFFLLPDLRGRAPVGAGTGRGLNPVQMGIAYGQETVSQTLDQLPRHNHTAIFTPNRSQTASVEAGDLETTSANTGTQTTPVDTDGDTDITPTRHRHHGAPSGGTVTVGDTGNNSPMPVVGPRLGMRYCIVTNGQFPPRD
ncbi:phage tail protein [Kordiimonas lacus]|uniref:Microcystin-dependent protein n=1 Tax=Kordiimonas lacus TaxID=637679 RepID=A0A1G6Y0D3_9PROT|nr:tail fiber protein [Kordiimonas lacus]SDD83177.1 Microcystin-dependent protein [Kordiimonas lacus]